MESRNSHILSLLSSSFLFRGLNSLQLQEIVQKTSYRTYPAGHILIEEDIISERVIYIIHGLVKVYKLMPDGKEIFLAIEKTGNYLGVMDLNNEPGSATIETLQNTKVLIFYKRDLISILQKNPFLWERMYRIILSKLNELKQFHSIRLGNDLYQRTYLLLQFLSEFSNNHTVVLSQETIASIVGATRPRVTEILHALKDAKKINISPKKITVL